MEIWLEEHMWVAYLMFVSALILPIFLAHYLGKDGRVWYKPWVWRCRLCGLQFKHKDQEAIMKHKWAEIKELAGSLSKTFPDKTPEELVHCLSFESRKWLLELYEAGHIRIA